MTLALSLVAFLSLLLVSALWWCIHAFARERLTWTAERRELLDRIQHPEIVRQVDGRPREKLKARPGDDATRAAIHERRERERNPHPDAHFETPWVETL